MPRVAAAIALILLAADGKSREPADPPRASPQQASVTVPQIRSTYVITEDNMQHARMNRYVAVQLRSKVTKETLADVARDLRSIEPVHYRLTHIAFYVPKQIPDGPDNPWATAIFKPELDVTILGLTPEREKQFRSVPRPSGPEVVGTWLVENTLYAQLVTIFKSGKDARLEERSEPAGLSRAVQLDEVATSKGRRFKRAGTRQIYDIDSDGVLHIRVNDELYAAARPLR